MELGQATAVTRIHNQLCLCHRAEHSSVARVTHGKSMPLLVTLQDSICSIPNGERLLAWGQHRHGNIPLLLVLNGPLCIMHQALAPMLCCYPFMAPYICSKRCEPATAISWRLPECEAVCACWQHGG